jgi:hypothetical protein
MSLGVVQLLGLQDVANPAVGGQVLQVKACMLPQSAHAATCCVWKPCQVLQLCVMLTKILLAWL